MLRCPLRGVLTSLAGAPTAQPVGANASGSRQRTADAAFRARQCFHYDGI